MTSAPDAHTGLQMDVAALSVYRCLSIGEAGGGVRAIRGSFGQGHSGVPGRCGGVAGGE